MNSEPEVKLLQDLLVGTAERLTKALATRNCVRCEHYREGEEVCSLYNARPPARTIIQGCDSWEDGIPF